MGLAGRGLDLEFQLCVVFPMFSFSFSFSFSLAYNAAYV